MPTAAYQDYIKAIYKLQQESGEVSTSALASSLGVTAASVSGMLTRLSRSRMVTRRHYRGVKLTGKGRKFALEVIRRHRLLELFLVEIVGMPWEKVHLEAERLEHVVSEEFLTHIDTIMGHPELDPHGSPIPNAAGEFDYQQGIRLDKLRIGERGVICEVDDEDPVMLQYLSKQNLVLGTRLEILEIEAIDGTITAVSASRKINISPKVASAIRVEKTTDDKIN